MSDLDLNVEKGVDFKDLTTFQVGGPARFFIEITSKEQLPEIIEEVKEKGIPFFILGNGSNLLVSDEGYDGLVLKINNEEHQRKEDEIKAGAGIELMKLVNFALENELKDLEWTAGIPGTLGGAIRGNAGAFNLEMKDIVKEVEVYDTEQEQFKTLSNKKCDFDYRQSVFKDKPHLVITEALLVLNSGSPEHIRKKIKHHLDYRKENHPLSYPCSGSVFQNPKTTIEDQELLKQYSQLIKFNEEELIPAGWLVEHVNLQGKKMGNAKISDKHANFIVNLGGAKAKDVMELINLAQEEVENKFNIELELEIKTLGF